MRLRTTLRGSPRPLVGCKPWLQSQLSLCGLSISSGPQGKSASLCLDIEGKVKKWVTQVYRYLGVDVSPRCTKANVAGMLRDGLVSILWAKLKPQQRLYIATYHLLPTCQHQLAAPASTKFLRWLYKTVRSALQSWLRGVWESLSMSRLYHSCGPSTCLDWMLRRIL